MTTLSTNPTLLNVVFSKIDKTVKYVFLSKGQVVEFSYINKDDGKDIICAPTQTACSLKCSFCFLSDYDLKVRNLTAEEILFFVYFVEQRTGLSNLARREKQNNVLLISFMGCGEPLLNIQNVIKSCKMITEKYKDKYKVVRFAVASLIPGLNLMEKFTKAVKKEALPLKFHLSLHSPDPEIRKKIMPSASSIRESIKLVMEFMWKTGNSAEIHYALIEKINDREEDLWDLVTFLTNTNISVKFLIYNEKPGSDFVRSSCVDHFRSFLESKGIKTEFYIPPGGDIGSSCGQFLMDYYEKYNKKKKK